MTHAHSTAALGVLLACLAVSGCSDAVVREREPLGVLEDLDVPLRIPSSRYGALEVIIKDVTPDSSGDTYFAGPLFAVQIASGGQQIAKHEFQTSYGIFHLDAIDLDSDGEAEYVLILGAGQGTSARREWMEILSLADEGLQQRYITPYSDFFGSGARWRYRHHYVLGEKGGDVEVHLELEHTPIGAGFLENPGSIPREKHRVLPSLTVTVPRQSAK